MPMGNQQTTKPDLISRVATYGAILFVGANLLYSIANGHWGSVAFMAVIAVIVLALFLRFVPLDDCDNDQTAD